ncbi:methyltransferase domain-containing protein [Myxococcus sp. SDU36]|uniref:methyltransferase domain-containing protein n=1 Tax=Myxococcus sp. SDU36 TaxID=2831967 RepID=UPI0025428C3E|nr:methyltransferase domain-containing protein [Myxococcus sp. SDU36]WIG94282.1 hypothetical protein KGD87_27580 [Myxococcus sp. SDU36]
MKALAYDAVMTPLGWLGLTAARRKLVRGLSGHVLEVGTGTGLALPGYPDTVTAVTAIDVDEAALARAQRRAGFDVERRVQRLQGVSELIIARRPAG